MDSSKSRSLTDIAWLAGICEGEASFLWNCSPAISLQMSDKDVVERVARLIGGKVRGPYQPKGKATYRQTWVCVISGSNAAAWMMTLYSFMGERRRAKIEEVLQCWKDKPNWPKARRSTRLPAICHPERNRVAFGKCKECYMAEWRATHRESINARRRKARTLISGSQIA